MDIEGSPLSATANSFWKYIINNSLNELKSLEYFKTLS